MNAPLVVSLEQVGAQDLPLVGGKGANLGELLRGGFDVPPGFCATTEAFRRFVAGAPRDPYAPLEGLAPDDLDALRRAGHQVRATLEQTPLPEEVAQAVVGAWRALGTEDAYAVRSSATAEDLPTASFAGQHETFLNVRGEAALLEAVKGCFISLFTDRAIQYRMQNGIDHRQVALAVVVQQMVPAEVAGLLFTADPVSGNRNVAVVEASFGLGEALVAGLVTADRYRVHKRRLEILERQVSTKQIAVRPRAEGGVDQVALSEGEAGRAALSDEQVLDLVRLGQRVEAHFGRPQDIEWALADGRVLLVQSRPITSLFPLPEPPPQDDALHVYFSLAHFQGVTDPMPPLAISTIRTLLPIGHGGGRLESRYIVSAGARLFADVSPLLRHPLGRRFLLRLVAQIDSLAVGPLAELARRPDFRARGERLRLLPLLPLGLRYVPRALGCLLRADPHGAPERVLARVDEHLATVDARLQAAGDLPARVEVAVQELVSIFQVPAAWLPCLAAGFLAHNLLPALARRYADPQDLTALGRGVSGNIETEMDLAVADLAEAAHASADLLTLLAREDLDAPTRLARAAELPGGAAFLEAWQAFLARYGARGPAEIDVSRPRWSEDPTSLLQMVVSAARAGSPGAHRDHYRRLAAEAEAAAKRVVAAASRGPLGWLRGQVVRRLIEVSRGFTPLRGHHKFLVVCLLARLRGVMLEAGRALAAQGRLEAPEEVWFLTLPEVLQAVRGEDLDLAERIRERRAAFEHAATLSPPHVMTSEGEVPAVGLTGAQAPEGALVGTPASAGVAEGPARVVVDPNEARLEPGEVLVAPYTDPGWTPLFVSAAGVVTETGGLMTHGAVVAREYGIPAVVGVEGATRRIRTGQRVRVHGDAGYVELLEP